MKLACDLVAGNFVSVGNTHLLPTENVKANTELTLGVELPIARQTMFYSINMLMWKQVHIGYAFQSRFNVENGGSYLVTYLASKGKAETGDILLRNPKLLIFNFPNRGTMAISPTMTDSLNAIFEEQ